MCAGAVAKARRLIAKEESIIEQLLGKRDDVTSAAAMDQASSARLRPLRTCAYRIR